MFQNSIQNTTSHLAVMFPSAPLDYNSFSDFPYSRWTWQFSRVLIRNFVKCPSIGISLMIFSCLGWGYEFWKKDHRTKILFSYQRHTQSIGLTTLDVNLDHLAEVVFVRFLHHKVINRKCLFSPLALPLVCVIKCFGFCPQVLKVEYSLFFWKLQRKMCPQFTLVTHCNFSGKQDSWLVFLMSLSKRAPPRACLWVSPCEFTSMHQLAGKGSPSHHNLRIAGLHGTSEDIWSKLLISHWQAQCV